MPRERHAEVLEVPQDRAQGPQVVDAEDDVEAAQVNAKAADAEFLLANVHGDVAGHHPTMHTVSIGHRHVRFGRRCRQAHATH